MGEKRYAVKEVFATVQGEGSRAGARSVFLRLAGCNAWNGRPEDRAKGAGACARWCDTDFFKGEMQTAPEVLARLGALWAPPRDGGRRWVVVSGGEPALQFDEPLRAALVDAGWNVAVETNGSLACEAFARCDLVTVSPKRGLPLAAGSGEWGAPDANGELELKVVLPGVAPGEAGAWTDAELEAMRAVLKPDYAFVQPMDPVDPGFVGVSHLHGNLVPLARATPNDAQGRLQYERHVRRCLAFVAAHPAWRVSVQVHKYISVP